jgi:hypothetical protein
MSSDDHQFAKLYIVNNDKPTAPERGEGGQGWG